MKTPIPFTATEQFLVSYYKATSLSKWTSTLFRDGIYVLVSAAAIVLFLTRNDPVWGFVGYTILLFRTCWGISEGRRWLPIIRSIFDKYETRISELETLANASRENPSQGS
jgi:hypothetical protein